MKTLPLFKLALSALLISGMTSCTKTSDKPVPTQDTPVIRQSEPSFMVEYLITPLNNNISRIAFNDENENTITSYDQSGFSGGAKMIMVSKSSYTARISVLINNMSGGNEDYHLIIMINGEVKQNVKVTVPPMTFSNFAFAAYTVQFK
jgi:hypothetical protein